MLMCLSLSNRLSFIDGLSCDGNNDLSLLKKLLFSFEKVWGSQWPGLNKSSAKHKCNGAPFFKSTEDDNKSEDADNSKSIYISNSLTSTEEGRKWDFCNTSSTSVRGLKVEYNSKSPFQWFQYCQIYWCRSFTSHHTSQTVSFSEGNTFLSLTHDKSTSQSSDRGVKNIKPDHSAGQNKRVQQDDKGKGFNKDCDRKNASSINPAKKRCRPVTGKKPSLKRCITHRHFSSPLLSDEETETEDESNISSYASIKSQHLSLSSPTPSHLTGFEGDTSDDDTMDFADEQSDRRRSSQMAVVYKQQSWEEEIVDERKAKQGRERPRKQYLIWWKPSWVDGGRLTAPELLQSWRKTKVSSKRRC